MNSKAHSRYFVANGSQNLWAGVRWVKILGSARPQNAHRPDRSVALNALTLLLN